MTDRIKSLILAM